MQILKKTAEFRVQRQVGDLKAEEVTNISLSGVPLLPGLIAPYTKLSHLTLVFLKPKLKSLQEIPLGCFPSLRMLNLSDNAITVQSPLTTRSKETEGFLMEANLSNDVNKNLDVGVARQASAQGNTSPLVCTSLKRLFLPNNCISEIEEIKHLAVSFPEIEVLDLAHNPIDIPSKLDPIFDFFPKLAVLNSEDRTGCEVLVVDSDETSNQASSEEDEESSSECTSEEDEEESNCTTEAGDSDGCSERKRARLS